MTLVSSYATSARRAYEAGQKAAFVTFEPIEQSVGWGYPYGRYYWYFVQGYKGREFELPPTIPDTSGERYEKMRVAEQPCIDDIYAEGKARKLIADEFRLAGQESHARQYETGGFTTAPLRALTRYISSRE